MTVDLLKAWASKEGAPPRPGLTFDRQKHRWVRAQPKEGVPSPAKLGSSHRKALTSTIKELAYDFESAEEFQDSLDSGSWENVVSDSIKDLEEKMGRKLTADEDNEVRSYMEGEAQDMVDNWDEEMEKSKKGGNKTRDLPIFANALDGLTDWAEKATPISRGTFSTRKTPGEEGEAAGRKDNIRSKKPKQGFGTKPVKTPPKTFSKDLDDFADWTEKRGQTKGKRRDPFAPDASR